MKTVRVCYTILHTIEVPDDYDMVEIGWTCEDFAEDNGFKSICCDWEANVELDNGTIISGPCMTMMERA